MAQEETNTEQSAPGTPIYQILDESPLVMRKPLAIIGDHAYAAFWPHVKITIPQADDDAERMQTEALVKPKRQLCIVRSDGQVFGAGRPLSDLKFEVRLKEIPPDDKLWSPVSAKAYARKELIDPCEIFTQVSDVIHRFIDFERSLADQRTMSELVACCILSTWFLDAFKVIGFLWPNGEPGSGKTQLLTLIAELGYLCQLILRVDFPVLVLRFDADSTLLISSNSFMTCSRNSLTTAAKRSTFARACCRAFLLVNGNWSMIRRSQSAIIKR